ncbi:hypothetical protein NDU88_004248 [Pleurodeles waltl]|uniref:Uncharacterized protein n=1 Tax=Pleurodeles waltl TaxID=8319 RepID=A0AAV7RKG4_PLEWA|nr:hypothetical protein NDU88_004248 [Pleurodeles waltl]
MRTARREARTKMQDLSQKNPEERTKMRVPSRESPEERMKTQDPRQESPANRAGGQEEDAGPKKKENRRRGWPKHTPQGDLRSSGEAENKGELLSPITS